MLLAEVCRETARIGLWWPTLTPSGRFSHDSAMKILWNILPTLGSRTGIGWYARETLAALRETAKNDEVYLESPGFVGRSLRLAWLKARPWFQREETVSPAAPSEKPRKRSWKAWALEQARLVQDAVQERALNRLYKRGDIDLYHEPNFLPWSSDVPTVSTFHDLSPILHPEWHPSDRVARFEALARKAVDRCRHVFTLSDAMCKELASHLGVSPDRISRTYMGVREGLAPICGSTLDSSLSVMGLKAGYFLHVGTLEPRKNLLVVAKAWASLPVGVREKHPLVLAGGWGWRCEDLRHFIDANPGIHRLGYVPEEHLSALYSGALALVFPTLYEGFGMPAVEMLACGGAVIASRIPVLLEIMGRHAHYVDPADIAGWRDAMALAAHQPDWLDAPKLGAVDHASQFTWKATAESTRAGYAKALRGESARLAA